MGRGTCNHGVKQWVWKPEKCVVTGLKRVLFWWWDCLAWWWASCGDTDGVRNLYFTLV